MDTEHEDALQQIKYLESKHQKTAEEELAVAEAPAFGHKLRTLKLEEGQSAHFESTLTPVNDATMRVSDLRCQVRYIISKAWVAYIVSL